MPDVTEVFVEDEEGFVLVVCECTRVALLRNHCNQGSAHTFKLIGSLEIKAIVLRDYGPKMIVVLLSKLIGDRAFKFDSYLIKFFLKLIDSR